MTTFRAAGRRFRAIGLWGLVLGGGAALAAHAQPPVFRTGVDAVRVDVLATDERGLPLPRLTAQDFTLLDNGVPQRIWSMEYEQLPLHVVLVLDISGSVEGDRLATLVDAAGAFVGALRDRDRATLVAFTHEVTVRPLDPRRPDETLAAIRKLSAGGWTSAFDAAWVALMHAESPVARSLTVLLSDGFDNKSWLSLDDVLEAASRVDTVVYSVRVPPARVPAGPTWAWGRDRAPTVLPGTSGFLQRIAEESGGRLFSVDAEKDVHPAFLKILDEFRQRYVLTYVPEGVAADGWHTLDVRLKGRAGRVGARRGYHRGLRWTP
jgi:VWFA-related protein